MFGSITTVAPEDVTAVVILAAFVLAVTLGLRRQLFAVCQDEEFARVTGLPVRALNLLIAVTAAVTVTVAMRIVGLLLVSAMMVIPVAAAQRVTRGFTATLSLAMLISLLVSLTGTVSTYYVDAPSGATIVLLAIGVFMVMTALSTPWPGAARRRPGQRKRCARGTTSRSRRRAGAGQGRRTLLGCSAAWHNGRRPIRGGTGGDCAWRDEYRASTRTIHPAAGRSGGGAGRGGRVPQRPGTPRHAQAPW